MTIILVSVIQPDGSAIEQFYEADFVPAASDLLNDPSVQEGVLGIEVGGDACMVWASPDGEPNPKASHYAGQPIHGPAVLYLRWVM
jgi:hypothetical protein